MKKQNKKTSRTAIFSILMTLGIYLGAVLIYFYANGWRVDPFKQEVIQTGVLSVESKPNFSNIKINGETKSRTPRSINLNVGTYTVEVSKDGYITWKKDVEIHEEKLTPVFPWLIKEERDETEIFKLEEELVQNWRDENSNRFFFLTKTSTEIETEDGTQTEHTHSLWAYDINRAFWDISDNPYKIFSLTSYTDIIFSMNLSPHGELAILEIASEEEKNQYLLSTTRPTTYDDLEIIDLREFANYNMTWSEDEKYLVFESEEEIISYNLNRNTKHLLFKKTQDKNYIWITDSKGYFYTIEENEQEEDSAVYSYSLVQQDLEGGSKEVLLEEIYFQKDEGYLTQYREERENQLLCLCSPFKNSPESTQTVGKIEYIEMHHGAEGVVMRTTYATYWYDLDTSRIMLISPYTANIIGFANNNEALMYKDPKGLYIFTFEKEDADHTVEIGAKKVISIEDLEAISSEDWLSNPGYIQYIEGGKLYIADKDGDNKTPVIEAVETLEDIAITNSLERVITLEQEALTEEGTSQIAIKGYSLE